MKTLIFGFVFVASFWRALCQCGVPVATPVRLVRQVPICQMFPEALRLPNYNACPCPQQIMLPELKRDSRFANPQVILNQNLGHGSHGFSHGHSHGFSHGHSHGLGFGGLGHNSCGFGSCGSGGKTKIKIKIKSRDYENNEEPEVYAPPAPPTPPTPTVASPSYGGSAQIPAPPCPKNYLFSCQPSVSTVPCQSSKKAY